jgi:hypothetical protein
LHEFTSSPWQKQLHSNDGGCKEERGDFVGTVLTRKKTLVRLTRQVSPASFSALLHASVELEAMVTDQNTFFVWF